MNKRLRKMFFFLLNNIQLDFTKYPEQAQEYASIITDLMAEHSDEENFQHFLSYSGYSTEPDDIITKMRQAFEANS